MHGGLLRVVWDPRPARRERGRAWDGVAAELLGEPEPADEEPEQEAEEEQEQPPDEAEKGDSVEDGGPVIWINAPRGQHDADSGSGRGSGAYRGRIYGEIFFRTEPKTLFTEEVALETKSFRSFILHGFR